MLTTIVGRGQSGTRAISHTLSASGVWMGEPLNVSGDLLPPKAMYEASRLIATHVRWLGGLEWDCSRLHTMPIPPEFEALIRTYLRSVLTSPAEHQGWKIPETTLTFPWIVRMFPEIRYIFWIRNPRDCIIGTHITDNLGDWGVAGPPSDDARMRRAMSWKYQYDLVRATPRPKNWIEVRFEDFVQRQDETLARLQSYLGIKLARISVKPEAVGRCAPPEQTARGRRRHARRRPAIRCRSACAGAPASYISYIALRTTVTWSSHMNTIAHRQLRPTAEDAALARSSSQLLSLHAHANRALKLSVTDGEQERPIELPPVVVLLLRNILEAIASGRGVTIIPDDAELTTVQAADVLNVSRPYLIKLLDEKAIPHRKVGKHRRIRMEDVMAYKVAIDQDREDVLDQMTREAQEQGLGYERP